jgi:hypothetical protein
MGKKGKLHRSKDYLMEVWGKAANLSISNVEHMKSKTEK